MEMEIYVFKDIVTILLHDSLCLSLYKGSGEVCITYACLVVYTLYDFL